MRQLSGCDNERGFSLIELLVVIAIFGLLTSVVIVSFRTVSNKARDARVKAGVSQLQRLAEIYRSNNEQSYLGLTDCFTTPGPMTCKGNIEKAVSVLKADLIKNQSTTFLVSTRNRESFCVGSSLVTAPTTAYCKNALGVTAITGLTTDPRPCDAQDSCAPDG